MTIYVQDSARSFKIFRIARHFTKFHFFVDQTHTHTQNMGAVQRINKRAKLDCRGVMYAASWTSFSQLFLVYHVYQQGAQWSRGRCRSIDRKIEGRGDGQNRLNLKSLHTGAALCSSTRPVKIPVRLGFITFTNCKKHLHILVPLQGQQAALRALLIRSFLLHFVTRSRIVPTCPVWDSKILYSNTPGPTICFWTFPLFRTNVWLTLADKAIDCSEIELQCNVETCQEFCGFWQVKEVEACALAVEEAEEQCGSSWNLVETKQGKHFKQLCWPEIIQTSLALDLMGFPSLSKSRRTLVK